MMMCVVVVYLLLCYRYSVVSIYNNVVSKPVVEV